MDDENRMNAAELHDPDNAARIVREIAKVEKDSHLAFGPLSERLMKGILQTVTKAVPPPWTVTESDWCALVLSPDWKLTKGLGNGDAWLAISDLSSEEVLEYSWLAAAVRAGRTQIGLELRFRRALATTAIAAIGDGATVAALLKLGFVRDEANQRLYLPIHVPAELLAQGFEQNDLDEALASVGKAVELAVAAKTELDALVQAVRDAAKRK